MAGRLGAVRCVAFGAVRCVAFGAGRQAPGRWSSTVSEAEIRNLSHPTADWWDVNGPFSALHRYNPTRVKFIRDEVTKARGIDPQVLRPLEGLEVLDIGCGGGILAEALCRLGGSVTGVDASAVNVEAAQQRRQQQAHLRHLQYVHSTAEELGEQGRKYDVIVASEVLEHVADVPKFLSYIAGMTKEGGVAVITTFNKTWLSFALGIVAAEYILGVAKRGVHDWNKFISPDDVNALLHRHGLRPGTVTGVVVLPDPFSGTLHFHRAPFTGVNYMLSATRPATAE